MREALTCCSYWTVAQSVIRSCGCTAATGCGSRPAQAESRPVIAAAQVRVLRYFFIACLPLARIRIRGRDGEDRRRAVLITLGQIAVAAIIVVRLSDQRADQSEPGAAALPGHSTVRAVKRAVVVDATGE